MSRVLAEIELPPIVSLPLLPSAPTFTTSAAMLALLSVIAPPERVARNAPPILYVPPMMLMAAPASAPLQKEPGPIWRQWYDYFFG